MKYFLSCLILLVTTIGFAESRFDNVEIKSNISKAIAEGKTEEEVKADSSLTKEYDDLEYGSGFINSERIRTTFYKSLKEE